jgi:amiloride-sensitive sodium channel
VLSNEEIPHVITPVEDTIKIGYALAAEYYIKINDILNQKEVRDVDISKRSCRFLDENYMDVYRTYSSPACIVNCRKNLQLQLCNCTTHFMPNIGRLHGFSLIFPYESKYRKVCSNV